MGTVTIPDVGVGVYCRQRNPSISEVEATAVGTVSMGGDSSLDHDGVCWTANELARPCQWCCLLAGLCEALQQSGEV